MKIKYLTNISLGIAFVFASIKCVGQVTTNLVPHATTAIKIAEAVWVPLFGPQILHEDLPHVATLQGDTLWIVRGTMPKSGRAKNGIYTMTVGGVPVAEIRRNDGKILRVYHTK